MDRPVPFESDSVGGVRSPQGGLSGIGTVPEPSSSSPEAVALQHRPVSDCSTEVTSDVGEAKEGRGDSAGSSVSDTERRLGEVQGVQSGNEPVGANEARVQAVRDEQPQVAPQKKFLSGQLVSTPWGIMTAEQVAERSAKPAVAGQTHGKVPSQHGVHLMPEKAKEYGCADCQDLLRRVVKAFKDMGYEFPPVG